MTFVERRKEFRLPYPNKVIFTDGKSSFAAYASNLSRGGLFIKTLDPLPVDTRGLVVFFLPTQKRTLCAKVKVAHIVFDNLGESDCGMGFEFLELNETQKSLLNLHILNEQRTYLELRELLSVPHPNVTEITKRLRQMRHLEQLDLLALKYRINRICTVFQTKPLPGQGTDKLSA